MYAYDLCMMMCYVPKFMMCAVPKFMICYVPKFMMCCVPNYACDHDVLCAQLYM